MKRTKRGERMAILTVEDQTGSTQAILFPDVFNNYSPLIKGDVPVLITGLAEVDDNSHKIIVKEIESLESLRLSSVKTVEIHLDIEKTSREMLEDLKDILFRHSSGECLVTFRMKRENKKDILISANSYYRVLPSEEMIKEVEKITGEKIICLYGEPEWPALQETAMIYAV
jgi:DNA polymerase-3 subunit alpha